MAGYGPKDRIKSVARALKFFSSQAQYRTVLKSTHTLSTVYRKVVGSGIFVYWFINDVFATA
jgi:hypothetical protein